MSSALFVRHPVMQVCTIAGKTVNLMIVVLCRPAKMLRSEISIVLPILLAIVLQLACGLDSLATAQPGRLFPKLTWRAVRDVDSVEFG